ncbi:MAG: ACP S-malonyltransferase [Chloroflexota bacterium]|nr:ACP S-malonyltransferase [Chloroflexota bacterium]
MAGAIACVFPGQGSQHVGMGQKLYKAHPLARQVFAQASDILGLDLASLCFRGPEEVLTDTLNVQPAILTLSIALWNVLQESPFNSPHPMFLAGHSLGEYSALVAAGALEFADALRLVRRRGELMQAAGRENPGGMAAVIGLDSETVERVCARAKERTGGTLGVANHNSPDQIVISGDHASLEEAMSLAEEEGARHVIPLAVSVASHSPFMAPAAKVLGGILEFTHIRRARTPVVANVSAQPIVEPEEIRRELVSQLTGPVRWVESVEYMIAQGVDTFVEVGPGDVLRGLIRRIDREVERRGIEDILEASVGCESR